MGAYYNSTNEQESDGGLCDYVTDEELELCQTLPTATTATTATTTTATASNDVTSETSKGVGGEIDIVDVDNVAFEAKKSESSPSKEVLIGGDNNPSRRLVLRLSFRNESLEQIGARRSKYYVYDQLKGYQLL